MPEIKHKHAGVADSSVGIARFNSPFGPCSINSNPSSNISQFFRKTYLDGGDPIPVLSKQSQSVRVDKALLELAFRGANVDSPSDCSVIKDLLQNSPLPKTEIVSLAFSTKGIDFAIKVAQISWGDDGAMKVLLEAFEKEIGKDGVIKAFAKLFGDVSTINTIWHLNHDPQGGLRETKRVAKEVLGWEPPEELLLRARILYLDP
jgi:hypothetical protein